MRRFIDFVKNGGGRYKAEELPEIRVHSITVDGRGCEFLDEERKWVSGRYDRNIGIDRNTHMQRGEEIHAHVYGRKREELVVVMLDGSASHGMKGRLHPDDASALRKRGFTIRGDGIVEWISVPEARDVQLLFG